VEKPPGMSVHNEPGRDVCSAVLACAEKNPALAEQVAFCPDSGIHPVHRLDRQTGGVLLLATGRESFAFLARQFEQRTVEKTYLAIVHGEIKAAEQGVWDFPLSADAGGRNHPAGKGKRYPSLTRFRLLRRTLHYSLIECRLLTGRKHQIRRHAKLAGHPVVGDSRYGSLRAIRFLEQHFSFKGLGLHAMSLSLVPPGEEKSIEICSSGFPVNLKSLLDKDDPLKLSP